MSERRVGEVLDKAIFKQTVNAWGHPMFGRDFNAPSVSEIVDILKQCEGSLDFAFRELDEQADVPKCELQEIGNRRSRVLNLISRLEV